MAYCKRYLLEKIIEIQNITIKAQENGSPQSWIYHNLIAKKYHISINTYYKYLQRNAKEELKRLNDENTNKQTTPKSNSTYNNEL